MDVCVCLWDCWREWLSWSESVGCGTNTSLVLTFQQTKQLSDEIVLQRVADILGEACSVAYCPNHSKECQRISSTFKQIIWCFLRFTEFHKILKENNGFLRISIDFKDFSKNSIEFLRILRAFEDFQRISLICFAFQCISRHFKQVLREFEKVYKNFKEFLLHIKEFHKFQRIFQEFHTISKDLKTCSKNSREFQEIPQTSKELQTSCFAFQGISWNFN